MEDALRIASLMFADRSVLATGLAATLVLVPGAVLLALRSGWRRGRALAAALAAVGLAVAFALTWGRWLVVPDLRWRGCTEGSALSVLDGEAILNWVILAPAAFFAALAWRRALPVLALAVVVPLLIEGVQSVAGLGTCQSADVLRNGGGALAATALGLLATRLAPGRSTAVS